MDSEEFKESYFSQFKKSPDSLLEASHSVHSKLVNFTNPKHVDWRTKGVIGPIKKLAPIGAVVPTVVSDHCGTDNALKMGTYFNYS